jgi:penicillin-binding protein 1C
MDLGLPPGAQPNLSIILGGTATRLENLVGAYAAFANGGIAGTPRYTEQQSARPRRLLSPGAAWIIRDILASNPADVEGGPLAGAINRHATVAWKTGTSYGYRDAWSIGVTDRWTIGVWIGRPDGTPSPGQYGAVTALPLLFQIVDMLPSRGGHAAAQPASVSRREICWPLGGAFESTPANLCRQHRTAWVLDDALPPTFAERDLGAWSSGLLSLRVDDKGRRLSGACHARHEHTIQLARCPALATRWLYLDDRSPAALPPLAPGCAADSLERATPIRIAGLANGVTLRKAPNSDKMLQVKLRALGTQASVQWLLNGRLQGSSDADAAIAISLPQAGQYRITALTRDGAFATLTLRVVAPPT